MTRIGRPALVFDDEAEIGSIVATRLNQLGFAAESVADRTAFLGALSRRQPELILLDLSLGDTDAVEVLGALRETGYSGPVILMSGHAEAILDHTRRLGEGLGLFIAGVLRKPFLAADLRALVEGLPPRPSAEPRAVSRAAGSGLVRRALAEAWLEFWFQPKVDLATGRMAGAEALARVRHPEHGVLGPDSFLAEADDEDMAGLTERAIDAACRAAREMEQRSRRLAVAVNISGRMLARPGFFDEVKAVRDRHGSGLMLVLELTETDLLEDQALARSFATRAMINGLEVSIDDFGHGYANFDRLRGMPFSEMKLDRSIVGGAARNPAARAICGAAVQIARGFGARIVAEGVEDREELAMVRALGFDLAQGHLFSRPVPFGEFAALPSAFWPEGG